MYSVYTFYMDTSRLLQSCIPTLWLLCFLIGQFTRVLEKFWPFTIPTSLLRAPDLTLCQHLHKGMTLTGGSVVRNPPAVQELRVPSLGQEYPLEKEMATHSSILAQRIPWTGEPGGLQSKGLQRVRHDWVTNTFTCFHLKVYPIFLFFFFFLVPLCLGTAIASEFLTRTTQCRMAGDFVILFHSWKNWPREKSLLPPSMMI